MQKNGSKDWFKKYASWKKKTHSAGSEESREQFNMPPALFCHFCKFEIPDCSFFPLSSRTYLEISGWLVGIGKMSLNTTGNVIGRDLSFDLWVQQKQVQNLQDFPSQQGVIHQITNVGWNTLRHSFSSWFPRLHLGIRDIPEVIWPT